MSDETTRENEELEADVEAHRKHNDKRNDEPTELEDDEVEAHVKHHKDL